MRKKREGYTQAKAWLDEAEARKRGMQKQKERDVRQRKVEIEKREVEERKRQEEKEKKEKEKDSGSNKLYPVLYSNRDKQEHDDYVPLGPHPDPPPYINSQLLPRPAQASAPRPPPPSLSAPTLSAPVPTERAIGSPKQQGLVSGMTFLNLLSYL